MVLINMASLGYLFSVLFSKAIAHYEQAADYYKGEESNR